MKTKSFKSLFSIFFICAISIFPFSCGSDECDGGMDSIELAFNNYENGSCASLDRYFEDVLEELREGKNCKAVKDQLEHDGWDSMGDYIDYLKEQHDIRVDNCNAPD